MESNIKSETSQDVMNKTVVLKYVGQFKKWFIKETHKELYDNCWIAGADLRNLVYSYFNNGKKLEDIKVTIYCEEVSYKALHSNLSKGDLKPKFECTKSGVVMEFINCNSIQEELLGIEEESLCCASNGKHIYYHENFFSAVKSL